MEEFVDKLLELVKENEFLYDSQHPLYRNKNIRDSTWEDIAKDLNETVWTVKKKWKNLKDAYVKYTHFLRTNTKNSRFKKWPHRHQLNFLDKSLRIAPLKKEMEAIQDTTGSSDIMIEALKMEDDPLSTSKQYEQCGIWIDETKIEDSLLSMKQCEQLANLPSPTSATPRNFKTIKLRKSKRILIKSSQTSPHRQVKKKKGKNLCQNDGETEMVIPIPTETEKEKTQQIICGDAVDHLFQSYAVTFKTLTLRQQVELKIHLAKLFAEAELESYNK